MAAVKETEFFQSHSKRLNLLDEIMPIFRATNVSSVYLSKPLKNNTVRHPYTSPDKFVRHAFAHADSALVSVTRWPAT